MPGATILIKGPGSLSSPVTDFGPPDLTTGLLYDFHHEDIIGADETNFTTWTSRAGSVTGLQLTPAGTAGIVDINGTLPNHRAVRMTAGSMLSPAASLALSPPATYATLCKVRDSTGSGQTVLSGAPSGGYHRITTSSTGTTILGSGSSSSELGSQAISMATWDVLFLVNNGTISKVRSGLGQITGTISNTTQSRVRYGANSAGTAGYGHIDYARMLAFSRALSDAEMVALRYSILDAAGLPTT